MMKRRGAAKKPRLPSKSAASAPGNRRNQLTYAQYLAQTGTTAETHQGQLAAQADGQIRALLVLRQIALLEHLQATDEAIAAEFDRLRNDGVLTEDQFETYQKDPRRRL